MTAANQAGGKRQRVRYAVVGLGWIAQAAMLPGFGNATDNSELVALVSGDADKRKQLGEHYGVTHRYSYAQYDECLRSGAVDAVYIALPDPLHREYTVRAAQAGVHVLCEKPMAVTSADCATMINAAREHNVKLMIAYRLHFDESNMRAVEIVQSGRLGEPRIFSSTFSQQMAADSFRVQPGMSDGTLYDIGIYCINAARYLFQAEPVEALAMLGSSADPRFGAVEEMVSATLRFPNERLAQFTCSFGATFTASYQVIGTKGDLRVDPGYGGGRAYHYLTIAGKTEEQSYRDGDHFGAQLRYFSDCILEGRQPQPSGLEGMIDVQIIEALYQSAHEGRPIALNLPHPTQRPGPSQVISCPPVKARRLVNTKPPTA
jgi:predicted dehydrogenase